MSLALESTTDLKASPEAPDVPWCLSVTLDGELSVSRGAPQRPSYAANASVTALFDGTLYNRDELERLLGMPERLVVSDAELLGRAFTRFGRNVFRRVRGVFAAVVWDAATRSVHAARDPIGVHPLFFAEVGDRLVFSISPERIVGQPGISKRLNELAFADWLCHRWTDPEETFYAAVKRVRPGYVLSIDRNGRRSKRYWDPAPPGEPVRWLTEDDLQQFDHFFSQAIERSMDGGPSGIFLSGGLDSVSVAAVATDLARRHNGEAPRALSLAFPGDECNEATVQAGVASQLGLSQTMVPFDEAAGARGLLAAALEMGRGWPQPMMNAWNPAYIALGSRGARQGCRTILTGSGGDEWLTVSSYHAADLVGALDLAGLAHMLASIRRSYNFSWRNILRATLWTYGIRPWITLAAHTVAPDTVHETRVNRLREATPPWVAPDQQLRAHLHQRAERALPSPRPQNGFYLREMRQSLEHPLQSVEMENAFEASRRIGASLRHPFWDADLVDLLFRIPPRLLNHGGRTKGLVRASIARRFPDLNFQRHQKVFAYGFFGSIVRNEGPAEWSRLGGVNTLAALGVVDAGQTQALVERLFSGAEPKQMFRVWDILHLEAWARARA